MRKTGKRKTLWIAFAITLCYMCDLSAADETTREGDWIQQRDEINGVIVRTMELTLTPQAESSPALKYHLILDDFDQVDGNAALFYLRAMGFLEQNHARDAINEAYKKAAKQAGDQDLDLYSLPPHVWQGMPPNDLPIKEVKQFLGFSSFQPRDLAEASRRRSFSMDRNIRQVVSPMAVLLPEIQAMRDLARTQQLRFRIAIVEGRLDDAFLILGQQYAMAKHLGTDEFLVSNLVGAAIAGMAWEDALYLLQHPDAPNLYWAFATLPNPLVDQTKSLAFERQFIFEQVKALREVNETPHSAEYWSDFLDRILPQLQELEFSGFKRTDDKEVGKAKAVVTVAAAYPGAKRFLVEDVGMALEKVEAYPTAQTVFLAMKKFYERACDDLFKWHSIPFSQAVASSDFQRLDAELKASCDRVGWSSSLSLEFLPSISASRYAQQRVQQTTAILQTIESIRDYGAAHASKLPASLDKLSLPAPFDPYTGKPLLYELKEDHAVLTGHRWTGVQYRVVLRFAGAAK